MSQLVALGAVCKCSMGVAPSSLSVIPMAPVFMPTPAATIMSNIPFANIVPFAMCLSMANPMTAALTAAAMGVFTPGPCIPNTPAPWIPTAPKVLIGTMPALSLTSKCVCVFGGVIQILIPGQFATSA